MRAAKDNEEEEQEEVRPHCAAQSRGNGIRQSPTLRGHLLQIRRR